MSSGYQAKIVGQERLVTAVAAAREKGKTIVQCHGCFDIVHPGHIRYLQFARQQGDVLIVSITGDSDVSKGDQRPYIPEELRAENLAALMFVDYVCITHSATAEDVLGLVQPDLYVKGREYENSNHPGFLAEKSVVEAAGGRIIFSSGEVIFSSTELIERMSLGAEHESHRLGLVCKRYEIDHHSTKETLDRFAGLRVLVVGDMIIDRYVFCDAVGVANEAPMLSLAHRDERSYLGGAAIVARHVAALGASTFLLTAGANDRSTKEIENALQEDGVDAHLLNFRSALIEKTRFIADDKKLFKLDRASCLPLDSVAERQAAKLLEGQSKGADAVIFCDFGYGMVTSGLLGRVLPTLRQNVGIVSADISGERGNLLQFQHVDLLCPTEREARSTLNDHDSGLSSVGWNILQRTQARHLFVTLEKRGMVVFERQSQDRGSPEWAGRLKSEQWPSFGENVVDRLGCGDALLATSTLCLAAGAGVMTAAYLGNAAAALEIAKLGNHPVDLASLREWTHRRGELTATRQAPGPQFPTLQNPATSQQPASV